MAASVIKPVASSAFAKQIQGKTLSIGVSPKVRLKDVHEALERIFRLSGCLDCGLNGYDLHLHAVNPAITNSLASVNQVPGIENIAVQDMLR